jgi:hypothetical protein
MISSISLGESLETKIKEAERLKSFPASSIFITTPPSSKPISLLYVPEILNSLLPIFIFEVANCLAMFVPKITSLFFGYSPLESL